MLVYDHVDEDGELRVDREPDEDDESYERRSALYADIFGHRR